ncbi:conserved Plasmodium protein, unknown function [Babesia microti strain RI]|uniref:Uncharacterized protein n=1 Tax=Babesia microti (strain RI) TaxID=1133968 RepID=A0A1N6LYC9_BABMR|nr:conserved Plasmodium protein, unknown function [Babesia microti strain RI]SIO73872.1 conserved Plasmodium protein, unknown function [Babesia microti strain RI]|eukprot:XP_021337924.1 conserved Plasmodium protein, unknown function [Babesia microti strain RI]
MRFQLFVIIFVHVIDAYYLHITKLRPNCADIVESPNFDFVHSAIHQCDLQPSCTYVIKDSTNGISLCRSFSLGDLANDVSAQIFIKPSILYGVTGKKFSHIMNHQGICEGNELIGEEFSVGSLEDACVKCKMMNCDYFTLSTVSGLNGSKEFRNHGWFCRGFPKCIPQDGFITSIDKQLYDDKIMKLTHNGPLSS